MKIDKKGEEVQTQRDKEHKEEVRKKEPRMNTNKREYKRIANNLKRDKIFCGLPSPVLSSSCSLCLCV
jgi:hypothetical protein